MSEAEIYDIQNLLNLEKLEKACIKDEICLNSHLRPNICKIYNS